MARRLAITSVLALLVVAFLPGDAAASVTGDCDGEATIKGVTYGPENDTPSNAIPIPDEDGVRVTYSGSVGFENLDHSGDARVQVGPFNITLGQAWSGSNEDDARSVSNSVYELDDFRDKLPIWIPGVWKISASHAASGGDCSGFAMVKLDGNPLGNPVGWATLVGLIGTGYWLISSLVGKRPGSAAIAALLLGGFLSLALMMWAIRPLDAVTTLVVPIVLAVLASAAVMLMSRAGSKA